MTRSRRIRGNQNKNQMQWRRIDLHIHTPGSKDYQQSDVTYLDILQKAESEGLDIIAFTDHNTIAGYAAMMQQVTDLERWEESGRLKPEEKERLDAYRRLRNKILVLPGFELTATFGFHILAIFDPTTPVRTLEHTLLQLNVPVESLDHGETEVGATSDVLTAYRIMAEAGALVIAAHANSSHGVAMVGMNFGGQTKIAYTQDPNLHALEVTDLESKRRRTTASFFRGSKPQYPRRMHCIQGSDAHRISGRHNNLGIGERATEVLLPEVSFEALKELFLGDDFARTRPYRRAAEPYDFVQQARQAGPSIVQSFHEQMTRRGGRMHAVLRDVVAFANTNGGTIYVGISPNIKVPLKGIENAEQAAQELLAEIERMVTPPIEIKVTVSKSQDKDIVRAIVPKGNDIPYVLEGSKMYLRAEAETSLAMRDEIIDLVRKGLKLTGRPSGTSEQTDPNPPDAREVKPAPSRQSASRSRSRAAANKRQTTHVVPEPVVSEPTAPESVLEEALPPEGLLPPEALEEPSEDNAPKTGVEIVASENRQGTMYHTMRDLRNANEVHNVTRTSARRLWRYAIALKEKHTFQEDKVTWDGNLGLWHKYLRAGRPHYDLVQKTDDGEIRIYYGVTEEGIHGPWRAVVGMED